VNAGNYDSFIRMDGAQAIATKENPILTNEGRGTL